MEKTLTFLHSGDMGDLIAGLCTVKEICERDKVKAVIVIDTTGGLESNPQNIVNVIKIQTFGLGMKVGEHGFQFLKPLIIKQPYVADVIPWNKDIKIDVNLNTFRMAFMSKDLKSVTNQNLVFLHQISNGLKIGYKGPWLYAFTNSPRSGIVIARSTRYQASHTIYESLRNKIKNEGRFIGTEFEYKVFENAFRYVPKLASVNDAFEAAVEINSSSLFISNSTVFYWIAVGLGHPCVIHEMSADLPSSYFPNQSPAIKYVDGNRIFK